MILAINKIFPKPRQDSVALELLGSIRGSTQSQPGCLGCVVGVGVDEEPIVLFIEIWESEPAFHAHVRSPLFWRVLQALEQSSKAPEVDIFHVSRREGMELIHRLRGGSEAEEAGTTNVPKPVS